MLLITLPSVTSDAVLTIALFKLRSKISGPVVSASTTTPRISVTIPNLAIVSRVINAALPDSPTAASSAPPPTIAPLKFQGQLQFL